MAQFIDQATFSAKIIGKMRSHSITMYVLCIKKPLAFVTFLIENVGQVLQTLSCKITHPNNAPV
jgi:hypothetical protein